MYSSDAILTSYVTLESPSSHLLHLSMDALGDDATHTRAVAQSSTSPLGKGPLKKDYAIGLLFLLAVVLLWTASNFVTQASLEALGCTSFLKTLLEPL